MVGIPRIEKKRDAASILLAFTLEQADYRAATRAPFRQPPFWPWVAITWICALLLVWLLNVDLSGAPPYTILFALLMAVALGSIFFAHITYRTLQGFLDGFWVGYLKKVGLLDVEMDMIMNPEGLSVTSGADTYTVRWSDLTDVAEDAERYYLKTDQPYDYIVPKRAFTSNAEQERLVAWLDASSKCKIETIDKGSV